MRFIVKLFTLFLFLQQASFANPYWDPHKVPNDTAYASSKLPLPALRKTTHLKAAANINALRVRVDWQSGEVYSIGNMIIEPSGTSALLERSTHQPRWGSCLGILKDSSGNAVFYDAIGTGREYRKLTRAITFRFPVPNEEMTFEMYAENPQSGVMEKVLTQKFSPADLKQVTEGTPGIETRELAVATKSPSLRVNIYAEGYLESEKEIFWQHAQKAVRALLGEKFPGVEHMTFIAVFHASGKHLGPASNLGMPVPEVNTFLGLYFPYWDNFGRWYNVIYPTREEKMRQGLAVLPYDFPIILVKDSQWWGVGNYMAFTAIPAETPQLSYLLFHEFGHFFGLNEEYQGGGRTELEFAEDIAEPWSQNITFLTDRSHAGLKWNGFVSKQTRLPTPYSDWRSNPPVYGAYPGGYADSLGSKGKSHRPGLSCVMEAQHDYCHVCRKGIEDVVNYSVGQ